MNHYIDEISNLHSLRVCPKTLGRIAEFSEHEANGGKAQECESLTIEILPIFGKAPAPPQPCERSFDDPPLRKDNESFCVIGTLDDLHIHPRHCHGAAKQRALIAAIGVEFHQERIQAEHGRHHERAAVTILNVSSMNDGMNQKALRIDENVPLLALNLLSRVVARWINRSPPFSALLTLWLSMTAAVGLASRPIASRHFT